MALFNGRIHRNPKRFSNPHELARAIDAYVDSCLNAEVHYTYSNKSENLISVNKHPPSIASLCLYLGFSSKKNLLTLMDMNPTIKDILSTTFLWIENFYITEALQHNAPKAYETMLKSFGYGNNGSDVETMKISRTTTTSSNATESGEQTTVRVEFIRPQGQISDDELKRQLMIEAGDDTSVVNAIESQMSRASQPKVIDAYVERQPSPQETIESRVGALLDA